INLLRVPLALRNVQSKIKEQVDADKKRTQLNRENQNRGSAAIRVAEKLLARGVIHQFNAPRLDQSIRAEANDTSSIEWGELSHESSPSPPSTASSSESNHSLPPTPFSFHSESRILSEPQTSPTIQQPLNSQSQSQLQPQSQSQSRQQQMKQLPLPQTYVAN